MTDSSTDTGGKLSRDADKLQHFSFDQHPVRGQVVNLHATWQRALLNFDYPPLLAQLIGESLAAVAMLANLLKVEGRVSLQAQGSGPVEWLMAEADANNGVRAMARADHAAVLEIPTDISPAVALAGGNTVAPLRDLLGDCQLAINIQPDNSLETQQGFVEITADSLAGCLEHYFSSSEQLPTRMWLSAANGTASGMMLQRLPTNPEATEVAIDQADADWEETTILAATITPVELRETAFAELLGRLFAQLPVRVYPRTDLVFRCTCSRQRTEAALRIMGQSEVEQIIEEDGCVEVKCEFCGERYDYDAAGAAELWNTDP